MRFFTYVTLMVLYAIPAVAGDARIYGQIMTASGAASGSPFPIYLNSGGTDVPQTRARVAFYDDTFLVVWNEWNGTNIDVKAARVNMSGTVLDTNPISIASTGRTSAMPDVAADSVGWMVVYHSFNGSDVFPKIYAQRVNYNGSLGASTSFGDNLGWGSAPKITWNGTNHLVNFTSARSNTSPASAHSWSILTTAPSATYTGNWIASLSTQEDDFSVAVMPGGSWTVVLHAGPPNYWQQSKSIAAGLSIESDGSKTPGSYFAGSTNLGYMLDTDDSAFEHGGVYADPWVGTGTAAATDVTYVIAIWTEFKQGGVNGSSLSEGDFYGARVDKYNPVEALGGTVITTGGTGVSYTEPSLDGDQAGTLLLAFTKSTDGSSEIGTKLLTVDGSGIDTTATESIIRDDTNGSRRDQAAVAYGNDAGTERYLVVWTEGWWGL